MPTSRVAAKKWIKWACEAVVPGHSRVQVSGRRLLLSLPSPFPTPWLPVNRWSLGNVWRPPLAGECIGHLWSIVTLRGTCCCCWSGRTVSGLCACLQPDLHRYPCQQFQVSAVLWVRSGSPAWAQGCGNVAVQVLGLFSVLWGAKRQIQGTVQHWD